MLLALSLALAPSGVAANDDLRAGAQEAFDAARAKTLKESLDGRIDAVWHTDLLLAIRPDPQLQWWADQRRRLQSDHLTYRLIEPTAALTELPEDPGTGLDKWSVYMRAPFGTPRELAVRYVSEYLGPDLAAPESGYILTHQLMVLEWSRMTDLPLPQELWDRKPVLLARIAAEHAADDTFSDLFAERICFLVVYGQPSDEELERSVRVIVDAQVEPGVWAPPPITLSYDGQSYDTVVEPEHARKMAMVALAEYLRRTDASAGADADADADAGAGAGAGADAGADADADADADAAAVVWWAAGIAGVLVLLFLVRRFRA